MEHQRRQKRLGQVRKEYGKTESLKTRVDGISDSHPLNKTQ